ncbi:MAG: hypothetical protein ABI699_09290 [Caldimonas sp.]
MKFVKGDGAEVSEETRRAAWERIVAGLFEIANSPEVLRAPGAWLFVQELEEACKDIGDNLQSDSVDQAMEKLERGFRRARAIGQHAETRAARDWVQAEWSRDRGGFSTKKEFAEVFAKRVANEKHIEVDEREIRERWLKGL